MWDKLCAGDDDWAQLAMHLWPERVVPRCANDRSLAIAHGLEDEYWFEDDKGKKTVWKKRVVSPERVAERVAERSSTAVKGALNDLISADPERWQAAEPQVEGQGMNDGYPKEIDHA